MIPTPLSYTVDAALSLPGIDVEVLTYRQLEPITFVSEISAHVLSMSLTPQVSYSRCCYLDAEGRPGTWAEFGDIVFAPRGMRHRVMAPGGKESYRGLYCTFAPALFEETTGLCGDWSPEQLTAMLNVRAPMIKRDLYRILKEVSESAFNREKLIETSALAALVELARYLRQAALPGQPLRSSLTGWQMRRIKDYVEGMIDHCPTVDELARLCEIGPGHLARAFKATTGRTIGNYVADVRMIKARSLLADTDLPLKEIAYRLGFAGPSSFCAAFGKAVGTTPKQFRLRHRS